MTSAQHAEGRQFDPGQVYFLYVCGLAIIINAALAIGCDANKKLNAVSEDRAHDLRIMRPTRCQLRYHRLSIVIARIVRSSYTTLVVTHVMLCFCFDVWLSFLVALSFSHTRFNDVLFVLSY